MARLRDASAYRRLKQPYSRVSKYRKKSYIKGNPVSKIVMFDMGDKKGAQEYPYTVTLYAKSPVNLRHNSIESARMAANRHLGTKLGKLGYSLKLRVVPHHIMRENALASGAGADRMQQGMRNSFGKPIGRSARVKTGSPIMTAYVDFKGVEAAKEALRKASSKIPISTMTDVLRVAE